MEISSFTNWIDVPLNVLIDTLPETNIAAENRPLEKEIPIGNQHFRGMFA